MRKTLSSIGKIKSSDLEAQIKYDRIKAKNDAAGRPSGPRPGSAASALKPGSLGTFASATREISKKYPSAANGGTSVGRTKAQSLISSRTSAVKKRK